MTTNVPMPLMTNTYVISDLTTTSQQVTLMGADVDALRIIVDNSLGTTPVFVCSGASSQTAVYPTSASVPLQGKVIPAGQMMVWAKEAGHKYVAGIRESGTADVVITVGSGV